jgi:hypothetical protein
MTRDELLASVHVLEPGDLLVIRVNRPYLDPRHMDEIKKRIDAQVPDGVKTLLVTRDFAVEQYRLVSEPEVAATSQ